MKFGYTRVSTDDQDDRLQRKELIDAGVEERHIYSDVITGASTASSRPGWRELRSRLREGDTLVVWRIDRLGRSIVDIITTVEELTGEGIGVVSVNDGINPSTPAGKMMLGFMATLAEYEKNLIRERVVAGMSAAKARGVKFGRPPLDMREEMQKAEVVASLIEKGRSVTQAGQVVGWSRATTYRRLSMLADRDSKKRA